MNRAARRQVIREAPVELCTSNSYGHTVTLRPYQRDAVAAILAADERGERCGLISIPTGGGKSIVAAEVLRLRTGRAVVVVHTSELGEQMRKSIAGYLGERVGLVSAGRVEDGDARVVVALRQSLTPGRISAIAQHGPFQTTIVDECHHAVEESSYSTILDDLRTREPDSFVLGMTATPWREDGKKKLIFERYCFSREISDLIVLGVLSPVTYKTVELPIELRKVRLSGSGEDRDYSAKTIEPELLAAVEETVACVGPLLAARRHVIVFAVSVKHAQALAGAFNCAGLAAEAVWGAQRSADRARAMQLWRAGEKTVLVNVGVVSEGFDAPSTDAIVFARPTASTSFYLQAVGRGLRIAPGKKDCLVIDAVGLGELRDPRQCTLDAIVPEVAALGSDPRERKPAGRKLVRTPGDDVGQLWHRIAEDVYALSLAKREWFFVARDHKSGLWCATELVDREKTLLGLPAPFPVVSSMLRERLREYPTYFSSVHAKWRSEYATPAQHEKLAERDPVLAMTAQREKWKRGRVSDAITVHIARRVARRFGLLPLPAHTVLGAKLPCVEVA